MIKGDTTLFRRAEIPAKALASRVQFHPRADRFHLIGVAGTGLRGMAGILVQRGYEVTGSEAVLSPALDSLKRLGVQCFVGHHEGNLPLDTQCVLVSAAIRDDNPEVRQARQLGIPIFKYAEYLGRLMQDREGVAIAGTHGKTTTTAMATQVLRDIGDDPGFIVGGECPEIGGSSSWGKGRYFVAEACEFDRSFLNLFPRYSIVTNVEEDHLDYFNSFGDILGAFLEFISHLPTDGYLVLNADDSSSTTLARSSPCPVGFFSLRSGVGDWWAENVRPQSEGVSFDAVSATRGRQTMHLPVPGIHNVKNALAVTALLSHLGAETAAIAGALDGFTGVRRRFEVLLRDPVVVIDDYAHHPTEIDMVLRATRETFPGRSLRVVFQPHQYSRTYRFLDDFASVLAYADEVSITEVFAARDTLEDMKRTNSQTLVKAVEKNGGNARYSQDFDDCVEYARQTASPGDVFICLGAGDITYLANRMAGELGTVSFETTKIDVTAGA